MRRANGFSLVEVMMATALLAVGIGLAFAALGNATRATERAEAVAQRQERLRAAQGFLRRQVQGALAIPFEYHDGTGETTVFESDERLLRFVAPMPGYLSRGGPYLQTFRLVPGEGGLRLEFEHQLLTPDGPIEAEREPEVLLDGIQRGAFAVQTLAGQGELGGWQSRWDRPGEIPRLVRLQLELKEPGATWPSLVAAPRLGLAPVQFGLGGVTPDVDEGQE